MGEADEDDDDLSSDSSDFINHVEAEHEPLYPGCENYSKMIALVKLFNLKIDEDDTTYHICETSRWKLNKKGEEQDGVPAKVLWYFPLIPRIRNLFNTPQIAKDMTWHETEREQDGPPEPGNDIDVFLQPLIEDLQELWHGKQVYDAYKQETFLLRGILLWTISDYPALGNLSENVIKGYNACIVCVENTKASRFVHYRKTVIMRHRRWLPRHHPYRKQKSAFDNTVEKGVAPIPLTGEQVLGRFLPVRHVLDVMHIEKNICKSLLGTLLNIPGKTKDRESVHLDMADMGIRTELRPKTPRKKEKVPLASWNLSNAEKKVVCSSFLQMKLPDGFCSNIKNLVNMEKLRLVGMKSHDCHTILHHLLSISIRSVLQKQGRCTIIRFCLFFKAICSKVIDVDKLENMQSQLVEILCQLEKHFPPSFFDVMIHLSIHLVKEVKLCGPIFLRWMYPFERYMKAFKGYVRNPAHPEGCIAEEYVAEEAIETELLHDHNGITDEIRWITEGPNKDVPTFSGCRINGVSYSTKDRDDNRQVQCSGVSVVADTLMLVEKDNTVEHTAQTYYGVITSIWELDYNKFRVPIFHCNWVDINKGVKVDDLGFILVNLNKLGFVNDPFVLGKHVKQRKRRVEKGKDVTVRRTMRSLVNNAQKATDGVQSPPTSLKLVGRHPSSPLPPPPPLPVDLTKLERVPNNQGIGTMDAYLEI
ncbi:uncharacterized protein LOC141691498 [Apium graveolens]|uniref:uncharacterized protein LOC141691498 n=1 Tax=Apium graveolens TaxID=4045 RepID=UPI003D7B06BA